MLPQIKEYWRQQYAAKFAVTPFEPAPLALTEDHVASLERAIRAEGYTIKVDTETGEVKLYKE